MAILDTAVLLGVADRLGVQSQLIGAAAVAGATGDTHYARITASDQPDAELALLLGANVADAMFTARATVRQCMPLSRLIHDIAEHITANGVASLATHLAAEDERVSLEFAWLWLWMRGESLPASAVFRETALTLGSIARTGVWATTVSASLGSGSGPFAATNTAPQGVELVVVAKGATEAELTITLTGAAGDPLVLTVVVPADSAAETVIPVTGAGEEAFALVSATGDGGDSGDQFTIRSIPERTPAL